MSLAEKLIRAKSDYDAVYEAGKAAGGASVDPDKIIEATASGVDVVVIDDVSEVKHDVTVDVSCRNLLDCGTVEVTEYKELLKRTATPLPAGTYTFSTTVTNCTDTDDTRCFIYYELADGRADGKLFGRNTRVSVTFTAEQPIVYLCIYAGVNYAKSVGDTATYENCQLELGTTATPYTPYVDTSSAKVRVLGKNLANKDEFVDYPSVRKYLPLKLKAGTYYYSSNLHAASGTVFYTGIVPDGEVSNANNIVLFSGFATSQDEGVFTISESGIYRFLVYCSDYEKRDALEAAWNSVWIQVELGNAKTEYEPYKGKEYELGETVKALCPTMAVTTDAEGVNIDVHYRKSWGKQTEYDAFWDAFQENGKRDTYGSAFYWFGWNDVTFKPKYDMRPNSSSDMFANSRITDLKGILERQGVELDLSKSTNVLRLCHGMILNTRFGVLDISSATDIRNIFYNCPALVSVDKVIFSEITGSTYSTTPFTGATNLEEIRCEGVLWFDVSFQWCSRLTRDSLLSIISVLKDYSGDTSGKAHTLSIGSYNYAKLTAEEIEIAQSKGWDVV